MVYFNIGQHLASLPCGEREQAKRQISTLQCTFYWLANRREAKAIGQGGTNDPFNQWIWVQYG